MNIKTNITLPLDLKQEILEFSFNDEFFKPNGHKGYREFCMVNKLDHPLNEKLKTFSAECYRKLGINEVIEETMFGNFIGRNKTGGAVHPHTDPRSPGGLPHMRLNFLVQKPESGGNPVIRNIEYPIEEDESWINLASHWRHSSKEVTGLIPRIVLSLGSFISIDDADRIIKEYPLL
jgi:hypothetical protein